MTGVKIADFYVSLYYSHNETMLFKRVILALILALLSTSLSAQGSRLSGRVLESSGKRPVPMAVVSIPSSEQWAVADEKGNFSISHIQHGKIIINVSCLGYKEYEREISVHKDTELTILLQEESLALEQVVVTAKENSATATTSRSIDRTAMNHMQMLDVSDISSLLPGGKTLSPDLSKSANKIAVRGSSFGTAVEIDGMRLSNNAAFNETSGISTKNISSDNIESVEVITGVPSVEYGDLTSGIVRIHTKAGRSPWQMTLMTNPRTKQFALSKGFDLGRKHGVLNTSFDRTISVRNLASPYTSYERNAVSVNWTKTGTVASSPLRIKAGLSGNIGGMNSQADPDTDRDTYSKNSDNVLRGSFGMTWMLNKPFITNLEFNASASYADKTEKVRTLRSSASSTVALHGMEEGYFVATDYSADPNAAITLVPGGYWYTDAITRNLPFDYNVSMKASWFRKFGEISSRMKVGASLGGSHNYGTGLSYSDMSTAPSWRPYVYKDLPFMNNLAAYAEESITFPIASTSLNLIAGLRYENTMVGGSDYADVNSLSPRFNVKYEILKGGKVLRDLSARASWGIAYKLPSFNVLYPSPTYYDLRSFVPGTLSDGSTYYAYYILPRTLEYNPELRWQHNIMREVGVEFKLWKASVSLSAFYNTTLDSYTTRTHYEPLEYKFTDPRDLSGIGISAENRIYSIDRESGIVTVSDKTGANPPVEAAYKTYNRFVGKNYASNNSPVTRKGVEWVVDFGQIRTLRTSFLIDGSYSYYKYINNLIEPYYPGTTNADGSPYPYIAYYVGGNDASNGTRSENLDLNLTVATHIPRIRMILSVKVESSLMTKYQSLSELSNGGVRSWSVEDKGSYLPGNTDIYNQSKYTITYPEYYVSYKNPDVRIPFRKTFEAAYAELQAMSKTDSDYSAKAQEVSRLMQLIVRSDYGYSFNERRLSAYYSVNFSITKEIGKLASISFYANNFFQNMRAIKSSQTGNEITLFNSGYIPQFYYGLTLRIKY